MVQTLEAIKGGGGSIRVGATGTIGSLMSRELESPKSAPHTPRPRTVSGPNSTTSAKRGPARTSSDQASTSTATSSITKTTEATRKTKGYNTKGTHRIPMLTSDNIPLDRTPSRQKSEKKGHNIVDIVDIKCGHPDRAWSNPITNKLKKLGFSKLSETIM